MADRMTPEEAADCLRGLVGADPDVDAATWEDNLPWIDSADVLRALQYLRERDAAEGAAQAEEALQRLNQHWRRRSRWHRLLRRRPTSSDLQRLWAASSFGSPEAQAAYTEPPPRLVRQILAVLSRRTPAFRRGHDDPPVSSGDG